jgi:hypothetical protein
VKNEDLIRRMMALTERWDWFKENIYDLKKDNIVKDLLNQPVIRDIHAGKPMNEQMVSELELLTDTLEEKYKPTDAALLDTIRKVFDSF